MLLFYGLVPAAVNLLLWGAVAWPMRRGWIEMEDCPWDSLLVPLVVLLSQVFTALSLREWHWHMAALFNLIFLAHATSMMVRGVRQASLRLTVQGSLLLGVLILARYFDLFQSLYARGLVFLAVGAAFIVEGVLYARSARRRAAGEGT
jgi:hypothetical protein